MYSETRESSGVAALVGFTLVFVGGLLHILNWDKFAFEIIPIKTKQIVGMASVQDLQKIAEICEVRRKYPCQQTALWQAFQKDPSQKEILVKLGELQMDTEDYTAALRTYTAYFKANGKDIGARFEYARALSETGKPKEAKKQFQYVLSVSRDPIQTPEMARVYVKFLIKTKDYATAKHVIVSTRRGNRSAAYFLEKELKAINSALGEKSS
jgi:tetratricopeptide (TPR) repeat protein